MAKRARSYRFEMPYQVAAPLLADATTGIDRVLLEGVGEVGLVGHVAVKEGRLGGHRFAVALQQRVEDDYLVARLQELLDGHAADVAGAAHHHDFHSPSLLCRAPAFSRRPV